METAALYYTRNEYDAVFNGSQSLSNGTIMGVDSDYLDVYGYQITKGRGFSEKDFSENRKVALLDKTSASNLFPDGNVIGKTIEMKGEPFTVIGLIARKAASQPVINSMDDYYRYMSNDGSGMVCVPDTVWPTLYQYDEPQNVVVRATSTDDMTKAGEDAAEVLNSYLSVSDDSIKYKGENLLEQATQIQEISNSTNQQLIWIASISLLVGGIGVMNIMLVSVTERTREIGLRMSVGARGVDILSQFLIEAILISITGGLIGVIIGCGASFMIKTIAHWPVFIQPWSVLLSFLVCTVTGVFFGWYPAKKAADLDPIDALRYE